MTDLTASNTGSPIYSDFADDADFAELLQMFGDVIAERRSLLEKAYQEQDWNELKSLAHQLKGAGGGYGFPGLSQVAKGLEQACKDEDQAAINLGFAEIVDYLSRISV